MDGDSIGYWYPNSMMYWYPKLKDIKGIKTPKTIMVEVPWDEACKLLDNEPFSKDIEERILEAMDKIGYPCFLRTDLASAKHDFEQTCYIDSKDRYFRNFCALIDNNLAYDHFFGAVAIREYIQPASKFKAFNGLPITPERRYFIQDGKVLCHHPYWPEDCIEFWNDTPEPDGWEEMLAEMNYEPVDEVRYLTDLSLRVANNFEGYWSIDYMKSQAGDWYLIDMAIGGKSYHPPCEWEVKITEVLRCPMNTIVSCSNWDKKEGNGEGQRCYQCPIDPKWESPI